MANKPYVGDTGTILLFNCGVSVVDATVMKILVSKPDGTEIEWSASIYEEKYLKYTIQATDWDMDGKWKYQTYVETPNWKGRGETVEQIVYKKFK